MARLSLPAEGHSPPAFEEENPANKRVYFYAIICRYLQVVPNNSDDDSLLTELLKLLDVILTVSSQPPEPVVAWVARTVLKRDGPQMTLLRNVQTNSNDSTVSESKR